MDRVRSYVFPQRNGDWHGFGASGKQNPMAGFESHETSTTHPTALLCKPTKTHIEHIFVCSPERCALLSRAGLGLQAREPRCQGRGGAQRLSDWAQLCRCVCLPCGIRWRRCFRGYQEGLIHEPSHRCAGVTLICWKSMLSSLQLSKRRSSNALSSHLAALVSSEIKGVCVTDTGMAAQATTRVGCARGLTPWFDCSIHAHDTRSRLLTQRQACAPPFLLLISALAAPSIRPGMFRCSILGVPQRLHRSQAREAAAWVGPPLRSKATRAG